MVNHGPSPSPRAWRVDPPLDIVSGAIKTPMRTIFMALSQFWARLQNELVSDPLLVLALAAALIAFAGTPLAFLVLGSRDWFKARRGRVLQRPSFGSIIVGMMLVMSIPAIFAAIVLKSRSFDHDRYEFDPNRTFSVLDQGRSFATVKDADNAVRLEMGRLAFERKNLVNGVKKLDEAMLALRAAAASPAETARRFPDVLQALAGVRRSVGVDGPQQLIDETAPPVDLRGLVMNLPTAVPLAPSAPVASTSAPTPAKSGLAPPQIASEIASVPEPQRIIASMLPLGDLPPEWTVGKSGDKHLETFNADNLYEKIDGRAESFIQYGVKGMAYAFYHPTGDPSNELQLYLFEMADPLKALGKYGSEKPDEASPVAIGSQGYTTAGSTLFYSGKYYTQIVSTSDSPKFAAFALELARKVAARQRSGGAAADTTPAAGAVAKPPAAAGPALYFGMLPAEGLQGEAKYVAQDVFGYSFLSDVFMADYKKGNDVWQGFLRPYPDPAEAKKVLAQYIEGVKKDGAEVKTFTIEGADEAIVSSNIGMIDVIFRKGNTLAGANGGSSGPTAEAFAKELCKKLPPSLPTLENAQ